MMSQWFIHFNALAKGFILRLHLHIILGWLEKPLSFFANLMSLSRWASRQDRKNIKNDFYNNRRDYSRRLELYKYVSDQQDFASQKIIYLEFGVFEGHSFRWWLQENKNPESLFIGFDTFEGLPEHWGMFFGKGTLMANIPEVQDSRASFIKGLFQDTLPNFIQQHESLKSTRKIIHLDADLFSSTLFTLASLHPFLNSGDVILFDEFNVPMHEYRAMKIMEEAFYFKPKLIGAVNNYYQTAFMVN